MDATKSECNDNVEDIEEKYKQNKFIFSLSLILMTCFIEENLIIKEVPNKQMN